MIYKKNNCLVSIIIPVYNGENYLREAIDSALAQTWPNVEVIVINDGSDDDGATERIALSYGEKIRYYKKENGGVSTALNLGIQEMHGEYFSWLSHDDVYMPNKISKQIEALETYGNLSAIVYSDYDLLEISSGIISPSCLSSFYTSEQLSASVFPILQNIIHGCTLLIHRSHFDRVGVFNTSLRTMQDHELWFRMFREQKLIFVSQSLVKVRIHCNMGTYTIPVFKEELGRIYLHSALSLSEVELTEIFGHPATLYHRVAGMLRGYGLKENYQRLMNSYLKCKVSKECYTQAETFRMWFRNSVTYDKKICIFGAGNYGKRLYFDLVGRGIEIDWFCDNNSKLWGNSIEDCQCISPKQLCQVSENTIVFVGARVPEKIIDQLKYMGCRHILTKQYLDGILSKFIPLYGDGKEENYL